AGLPRSTPPSPAACSSMRPHASGASRHDEGMRQLIVDGYNTIHAWPSLKAVLRVGGLEEARGGLISRLSAYAAVRNLDITVVFDGRRRGPAPPTGAGVEGITATFRGRSG